MRALARKHWLVIAKIGDDEGFVARLHREGRASVVYEATRTTSARAVLAVLTGAGIEADVVDSRQNESGRLTTANLANVRPALGREPESRLDAAGIRPGVVVRLARDVERFPHFIADAGMVGTVVVASASEGVAVRMSATLDNAEEWDNQIVWPAGDDAETLLDLEVMS